MSEQRRRDCVGSFSLLFAGHSPFCFELSEREASQHCLTLEWRGAAAQDHYGLHHGWLLHFSRMYDEFFLLGDGSMQGTAVMTYGQMSRVGERCNTNCIGRGWMNTHGQLERRNSQQNVWVHLQVG